MLLTPSSVRNAISSYTTGRNSTKLASSLPLMVRVCESNIFLCVRPSCVRRPSTCLSHYLLLKKKVREKPGSATITNRNPSRTPRGRGNRQIQTSTYRTNVRKALRLALSFQSEVIAMQNGLKNTRKKNDTR